MSRQLMRHDGDNTLKYQEDRKGIMTLPRNPMECGNFGLIDSWEAIRRLREDSRMIHVEIVLSEWLYRAITNLEVLTLHRDYFRLDGGIERRMYELCRKHCGHQDTWSVHVPLLYKKSGAISPIKRFRQLIRG